MTFNLSVRPGVKLGIEIEDYCRYGKEFNFGVAEIRTVDEIESAGSGFLSLSKRPKILFEGHVFYRLLKKHEGVAIANKARQMDRTICFVEWTKAHYIGREGEYSRLAKATEICHQLGISDKYALMACSWGRYQILADNYKESGFNSPEAMVEAMFIDEENHLKAFCAFLVSTKLDDDLRAHRWDTLARGYNGPAYKNNAYHIKLPNAFARFSKQNVDCSKLLKGHVVDVMPGERSSAPDVVGFDNTALDTRYVDGAYEVDTTVDDITLDETGINLEDRETTNQALVPTNGGQQDVPTGTDATTVQVQEQASGNTNPFDAITGKVVEGASWFSGKMLAIPSAVLTFVMGIVTWFRDAPPAFTLSFFGGAAAIVIFYLWKYMNLKDKREERASNEKIEALKLQQQLENQKHEILKLQIESASRKDLNTVQVIPAGSQEAAR